MKGAGFNGSEEDFIKNLEDASYRQQAQRQGNQVSPEILKRMDTLESQNKSLIDAQNRQTFAANLRALQDTFKLNNNELKLNKDGIYTDSETGRKFRLATNKNSKTELVELTKKEVVARHLEQPVAEGVRANSTRHSEAPAEESRGTSTQQIKSFKERINNAETREELNAIRSEIKKTDLTVQERNELMKESLKVQREWGQAPERRCRYRRRQECRCGNFAGHHSRGR